MLASCKIEVYTPLPVARPRTPKDMTQFLLQWITAWFAVKGYQIEPEVELRENEQTIWLHFSITGGRVVIGSINYSLKKFLEGEFFHHITDEDIFVSILLSRPSEFPKVESSKIHGLSSWKISYKMRE